jgi:hypothetical protein
MADTGWVDPGTMGENSSVGSYGWTSLNNAKALGGGTAESEIEDAREGCYYIVATNYDFSSIPAGSTINGIEARCRCSESGSGSDIIFNEWKMYVAGSLSAYSGLGGLHDDITNVLFDYDIGGALNDWGFSAVALSDVQHSGFGHAVELLDDGAGSGDIAYVDHMPMKIHYTAPAGGSNLIWPIT